jgi:protein-tyrosine phosphatase
MAVSVLYICLGNICRSPIAQGSLELLLRESRLTDQVHVDSAGTAAFNVGKSPDPRAIAASQRHSLDISSQVARQIDNEDYARFQYVIAMDRVNLSNVRAWAPADYDGEIELLLHYSPNVVQQQISDPYYEDESRFDAVFEQIKRANQHFLNYLTNKHQLG